MLVINQEQLPFSRIARELEGRDHDEVPVCLIFVDAPPGDGPGLHTHAYHEIFLVQEGAATFTAGDEERVVGAGDIVVVPPEVPHRFLNTGDGQLRMTTIHTSAHFNTTWL
jgi:mannose-6-phosphate isomerase-like protein (cupin superfamily)